MTDEHDHRRLGQDLDLFVFSELVGSGLPLWTPRGTILRQELDAYVWELRSKYGYSRVTIPHITKRDLYEKSGHWEKFSEDLFADLPRGSRCAETHELSHHTSSRQATQLPKCRNAIRRQQWSIATSNQAARWSHASAFYHTDTVTSFAARTKSKEFMQTWISSKRFIKVPCVYAFIPQPKPQKIPVPRPFR